MIYSPVHEFTPVREIECQTSHSPDGYCACNGQNLEPMNSALQSPVHVLLVEDDAATSLVMGKLLCRLGYHVQSADSVAKALELIDKEPVDVMLSDISLPDGSGYELMDELRNRCSAVGIAMSGYDDLEDLDRSHRAGFATHLVKPIDFDALKNVIARLLAR